MRTMVKINSIWRGEKTTFKGGNTSTPYISIRSCPFLSLIAATDWDAFKITAFSIHVSEYVTYKTLGSVHLVRQSSSMISSSSKIFSKESLKTLTSVSNSDKLPGTKNKNRTGWQTQHYTDCENVCSHVGPHHQKWGTILKGLTD